jgi:hypothetical protein
MLKLEKTMIGRRFHDGEVLFSAKLDANCSRTILRRGVHTPVQYVSTTVTATIFWSDIHRNFI